MKPRPENHGGVGHSTNEPTPVNPAAAAPEGKAPATQPPPEVQDQQHSDDSVSTTSGQSTRAGNSAEKKKQQSATQPPPEVQDQQLSDHSVSTTSRQSTRDGNLAEKKKQQSASQPPPEGHGRKHSDYSADTVSEVQAHHPRTKSTLTAYLLWLVGGVLGLHLWYLERDAHHLLHVVSFGGCGVGFLLDVFLLPSYVRQANGKTDPPGDRVFSFRRLLALLLIAAVQSQIWSDCSWEPALTLGVACLVLQVGRGRMVKPQLHLMPVAAVALALVNASMDEELPGDQQAKWLAVVALGLLCQGRRPAGLRSVSRAPFVWRLLVLCATLTLGWLSLHLVGLTDSDTGKRTTVGASLKDVGGEIVKIYSALEQRGWWNVYEDFREWFADKSHWALQELELPSDATRDDIQRAFRKLSRRHHPDKEGGSSEKQQRLNKAKKILLGN